MSTPRGEWTELEELLGALRDGQITAEQAARLEQRLAEDQDARAYYLEYIDLCSMLWHYQGLLCPVRGEPGDGPALPLLPFPLAPQPPPSPTHPLGGTRASRRLLWLSAVVAALLAVGLAVLLWPRGSQEVPIPARLSPPLAPATVLDVLAMMIHLEGVAWEPADGPPPAEGDVLSARRLRLRSGRATLNFFSGVSLTMEGPADVDLIALDRVFCRRGRLRVRVPEGVEEFVVASAASAVADLGTEFALNVEADGRAQVLLFKGMAVALLLDEEGVSHRTQLIEQSKAFLMDPRADLIAETGARPEGFIPTPAMTVPSLDLDPSYPGAVLRSRPRGYWRFESLAGGAVPNEVPGGPPLRVHGPVTLSGDPEGNRCGVFQAGAPEEYLTTDGLWELARESGHAVELWFLADGFHSASLFGLFPPRGLNPPEQASKYLHTFLVELTGRGRQLMYKPASVRFLHRWPLDVKVTNNLFSEKYYFPGRWHHVVAQKQGDRMELYFDGVPDRARRIAPNYPPLSCHLVIGRKTPDPLNRKDSRTFVGRLDEIAIYDRPLSPEEIRHHFQSAAPKARPG